MACVVSHRKSTKLIIVRAAGRMLAASWAKVQEEKKTVLLKKIKTHIAGLRHTAVHALLNNITARG